MTTTSSRRSASRESWRQIAVEAFPDQACAYCGSAAYSLVIRFATNVAAVRCQGCRLVRTVPYPTFNYEGNKGYAMGYAGREHLFAEFARVFMDSFAIYTPGNILLEVGCGMGFLLEEARRRGYIASGLEINQWEVELTRARGLDVQAGTLADAHLPAASIDVICMSHVLEHVQDLRRMLTETYRVLRPDGIFALCQPYYGAPLPRALPRHWYGWQPEQHVWHFDVPALTRVLANHGLQRIDVAYNSLHHPWLPMPMSWRFKVLAVQAMVAAVARLEAWVGRGDQFVLVARREGA